MNYFQESLKLHKENIGKIKIASNVAEEVAKSAITSGVSRL